MLPPRRPTQLDSLPLATVVLLALGMVLWAAGGPAGIGRSVLGWEGEDGRLAHLDEPPGTLWGDRSLGQLLERVFDPAGRVALAAPEDDAAEDDEAPPGRDRGAHQRRKHFVLTGAGGELLAEGFVRDGVPEGRWVFRNADGRRRADGVFQNGQPHASWLAWHADGSPAAELEYTEGTPEGLRVEWWPNGSKRLEGLYENGLREGLWRRWHENGAMRSEGEYHLGLRVGRWKEWHSNARPSAVCEYIAGRRHGELSSWYAGGGRKEKGWFEDGLREGMWFFDEPDGARDRRTGFYAAGVRIRD